MFAFSLLAKLSNAGAFPARGFSVLDYHPHRQLYIENPQTLGGPE
jgi:hypothetical protein